MSNLSGLIAAREIMTIRTVMNDEAWRMTPTQVRDAAAQIVRECESQPFGDQTEYFQGWLAACKQVREWIEAIPLPAEPPALAARAERLDIVPVGDSGWYWDVTLGHAIPPVSRPRDAEIAGLREVRAANVPITAIRDALISITQESSDPSWNGAIEASFEVIEDLYRAALSQDKGT